MATAKSTVLGFRLDHERRAWVEAEAARRGVTLRVLFEGLIDEARTGGSDRTETPGSAAAAEADARTTVSSDAMARPQGEPVAGVPGGLIHEVVSLTSSLVRMGGRCALKTVGACPIIESLGRTLSEAAAR